MKTILFITNEFPSKLSPNSFCNSLIINRLKTWNETRLIVVTKGSKKNVQNFNQKNFNVYYHSPSLLTKINNKIVSLNGIKKIFYKFLYKSFLRISQLLLIPFYPMEEPIFTHKFSRFCYKIAKNNSVDAVISAYHDYDTLKAGVYCKKHIDGLAFISIFWDSLSGGLKAKYLTKNYAEKRMQSFQKRIISESNKTICLDISEKYMRKWATEALLEKTIFLGIPRIINQERLNTNTQINNTKITILYCGSLSGRDPTPILNYLLKHFDKNIEVCFYSFAKEAEKKRLYTSYPIIKIKNPISHDELIGKLELFDYYLNLGNKENAGGTIPSKLYEYISFGKPIITTIQGENDPAQDALKNYKLSYFFFDKKENNNLYDFILKNRGQRISFEDIKRTFENCTPEKYDKILKDIILNNYEK